MNFAARYSLPLATALALAACSGGNEEPAPSETTAEAPAAPAPATSEAPARPQIADAIPAAFHGVWDTDEGNCVVTSITRMEIAPAKVDFYESQGDVTRVEIDSADKIVVSLTMAGEGEQWQMARMFTLSDDGALLTPTSVDPGEPLPPVAMKKCAA